MKNLKVLRALTLLLITGCSSNDDMVSVNDGFLMVKSIMFTSEGDNPSPTGFANNSRYNFHYNNFGKLESVYFEIFDAMDETKSYSYSYPSENIIRVDVNTDNEDYWRQVEFDDNGMIIKKHNSWMDSIPISYYQSNNTIYYESDFGNYYWIVDSSGNKTHSQSWEIEYDNKPRILEATGLDFFIDGTIDLEFLGDTPYPKNNPTRVFMRNLDPQDIKIYQYSYNEQGYPISAVIKNNGISFFGGEIEFDDTYMTIEYY